MITGNREKEILSVYSLETEEDRIAFYERWDFCIVDVLSIAQNLCIHYSLEELTLGLEGDVEMTIIETENYIFRFINGDFVSLSKKYNVLNELREKYNLPI